jgi:hypothetical protein
MSDDQRPACAANGKPFVGLMLAYGSNLHAEQMSRRCPAARSTGRMRLPHWLYGGVWLITAACEVALDRYEGIGSGMYRKEYLPLKPNRHGFDDMLVYRMNSTGIFPPSTGYLATIEQGYRDFHMPKAAHAGLQRAVHEAWDDKAPSHAERQRYRRTGRPKLAQAKGRPEAAA